MTEGRRLALAWTGFVIGPLLWAVNTQLGQVLPYAECGGPWPASAILSAVGVLLSLGGAAMSWRVSGLRQGGSGCTGFMASVGALVGVLTAFALLLQSLSGLLVSPCAR
ncbi:hypothetical protein [Muricoccus radiodurans]|uniref:hypothetical protein n=1 Tax=Muricoccus radiodurans TaxID=2231721 RepID=UPI003CE77D6A